MAESVRAETGTIYDIGYQRYDGERLGRSYAIRSLFAYGLRTVFALGRGIRAALIPWGLVILAVAPAVVQALASAYLDIIPEILTYSNYFASLAMVFTLFCASRAPALVSADQRTNTLVLYFARALHREDYVVAKVLSLAAGVFLLTFIPLLLLFVGRVFASASPWPAFWEELPVLLPILGSSAVMALFMAAVSAAIASLTPRRGIAATGILAYFILAGAISGILRAALEGEGTRWLVLIDPGGVLRGFAEWAFGARAEAGLGSPVSDIGLPQWTFGAACVAYICLASTVLVVRYRRIDA